MKKHRSDYQQWLNGAQGFISSFLILENGDYSVEMLEHYEAVDNSDRLRRERFWMDQLDPINKVRPFITEAERKHLKSCRQKENARKVYLHHKQYRHDNFRHVQEYHKDYWMKNKEALQSYHSSRYEERKKQPVLCKCGTLTTKAGYNNHVKTKKHHNALLSGNGE